MDASKEIDFRLLLEQLPAIVWATDRDLRFVYSRGAGLAALSLTEYLGSSDPADPTVAAHYAALGGVPTVYELAHGRRVYQVHVEPWRAGSAGIVGVLGVALDITDRARAEAALARSERALADFFENAALGLTWIGLDGVILRVNQTELDLLGYARDEYVGRHVSEFHIDPEIVIGMLARLARGETVEVSEARATAPSSTC